MWMVIMILRRKTVIKWAIRLKWSPIMEALVIIWHICCSKCHSMMYISNVLGPLIIVVYELNVLMMVESYIRCIVRNIIAMMKSASYIWFVILGPGGVSICVLLFYLHLKLLFVSLFLGVIGLLLFWSDGCLWWLLFCISFKISGNCLSNVGTNLPNSKYKRSIFTSYVLQIYWTLLLISFIRSLYTLPIWTGSAKLISFMQFLNVIFIIPKYFV